MYKLREAVEKYETLLALMKERETMPQPVERSIARCLYFTGDEHLIANAEALYRQYPVLGFRPFKAAGYVHHEEIVLVVEGFDLAKRDGGGLLALAHRHGRPGAYEIGVTDSGVLICSCLDYQYNAKVVDVLSSPSQQPCCHILALALKVPSLLKLFLE